MEPQAESPQATPQVTPETQSPAPVVTPQPEPPKKKSKKLLVTFIVILLLAAAGVGGYLYANRNKKPAAVTSNTTTTKTDTTTKVVTPAELAPYAVIVRDYNDTKKDIILQPLDGSKAVPVTGLGNTASVADVHKNKVLATDQVSTTNPSAAVYYSKDSGKTFKKLFSGKAAVAKDDFGDQITSAKLSTNGSIAVVAVLNSARKNTVMQLDLETGATKDLFTSDSAGVFISRFDATTKKIFYQLGCYDCDGGPTNKLYVYDVASAVTSTFYDGQTTASLSIILNADATKIALRSANNNCDGIGSCKPYELSEYDVATKAARKIATVDSDISPTIGFREDNMLYYVSGSAVTLVDATGKETVLFQSNQPILYVEYVGTSGVVAQVGAYKSSKIVSYDVTSKKTTDVLSVGDAEQVSQVIWQ